MYPAALEVMTFRLDYTGLEKKTCCMVFSVCIVKGHIGRIPFPYNTLNVPILEIVLKKLHAENVLCKPP